MRNSFARKCFFMFSFLATSLSYYQCGIGTQPACKIDPNPDNLKPFPLDDNKYRVFANASYSKIWVLCLFKWFTKIYFDWIDNILRVYQNFLLLYGFGEVCREGYASYILAVCPFCPSLPKMF